MGRQTSAMYILATDWIAIAAIAQAVAVGPDRHG
jgi:hypothetical protein